MSLSFKDAEDLETETKLFEDLEFQQLERESRAEEERELAGQGLLRGRAELLRSIAQRKVRPCAVRGAGDLGSSLRFLVITREQRAVVRVKHSGACEDSLAGRRALSKQQRWSPSPDPSSSGGE